MVELLSRTRRWISNHSLLLVVLLSIIHVGLACIHSRDSGGADNHQNSFIIFSPMIFYWINFLGVPLPYHTASFSR